MVVLDSIGNPGASAEEVCRIAECEVNDGFADYAVVYVDGETYAEYTPEEDSCEDYYTW